MKICSIKHSFNDDDNLNDSFLLCCMRDLLLTEKYAPMDFNYFYDQFFSKKLSDKAQKQVMSAKSVWNDIFEDEISYSNHLCFDEKNCNHFDFLNVSENSRVLFLPKISINQKPTRNVNQLINQFPKHLPETFHTVEKCDFDSVLDVHKPTRVILESPFAGDFKNNVKYASDCIFSLVLKHGKAPMASHLIYTKMLDDDNPSERKIGIDAGLSYGRFADESVICVDRGLSNGIKYGILNAEKAGRPFRCFSLSDNKEIHEEISEINNLSSLESWVEKQMSKNSELYSKTGFIVNV